MTAKKKLVVKRDIEGYFKIMFEGGGQLPEALQGIFTKERYAELAITLYEREKAKPKRSYRKPKKVETNGEDKTTTDRSE